MCIAYPHLGKKFGRVHFKKQIAKYLNILTCDGMYLEFISIRISETTFEILISYTMFRFEFVITFLFK